MGFLSSLLPIAGTVAGSYFGGPVGGAIGGALGGALGGSQAYGQESDAAAAALAAGRTIIPPQLREAFDRAGVLGERELKRFGKFDLHGQTQQEANRLQGLRAPSIESARQRLQSQLLNRGRLGLGQGGGRTGSMFQPETAALEEAILQAQLGDIGAARGFATSERQAHLGNAQSLFGIADPLIERPNPGLAAMQAQPGFNQASGTRGFFSGLGQAISGGFGSFGGSGGSGFFTGQNRFQGQLNPRGGI